MKAEGLEIIRLELKYCERCGGLWLRTQGTGEVYCPACAGQISELPGVPRKRKPYVMVNDRLEIKGQWEELPAVYGDWGNA
jgi:hypothetical protein